MGARSGGGGGSRGGGGTRSVMTSAKADGKFVFSRKQLADAMSKNMFVYSSYVGSRGDAQRLADNASVVDRALYLASKMKGDSVGIKIAKQFASSSKTPTLSSKQAWAVASALTDGGTKNAQLWTK